MPRSSRLELIGQRRVLHPHRILRSSARTSCRRRTPCRSRRTPVLGRQHVGGGIELTPHPGEYHCRGIRRCDAALEAAYRRDPGARRGRKWIGVGIQRRGVSPSVIRPVEANSRKATGTSPRGQAAVGRVAYTAAAHRSSGESRVSKAGIAVPATPIVTRR